MNIEGDYLWDKSGEPDPEVQQLEEILGTLRYQPRPLEIPAGLQTGLPGSRRRNFFRDFGPRLAIAATIGVLLVGLGLWFGLQRLQRGQPSEIVKTPGKLEGNNSPTPAAASSPNENQNPVLAVSPPALDQKRTERPLRPRVNPSLLAGNSNRVRNVAVKKNQQLAVNKQEGEAAKDQLMLALRVASAKLNFAQKKTQNTNSRDQIHNQHKIG